MINRGFMESPVYVGCDTTVVESDMVVVAPDVNRAGVAMIHDVVDLEPPKVFHIEGVPKAEPFRHIW